MLNRIVGSIMENLASLPWQQPRSITRKPMACLLLVILLRLRKMYTQMYAEKLTISKGLNCNHWIAPIKRFEERNMFQFLSDPSRPGPIYVSGSLEVSERCL